MRIEQLMTKNVVTVTPETPLKDAAELLSRHHISGLPVVGAEGEVLGVVSEADILRREEGLPPDVGGRFGWFFRSMDGEVAKVTASTAGEAMTAPALTVRPREQVTVAARLMIEHRINRLPVVYGGRLVGIISRADLVRAFHRSDEELEREIREETLAQLLWIEPATLEVSVREGLVTLRGEVESEAEAEAVRHYVRAVPGILDVDADLWVRAGSRR